MKNLGTKIEHNPIVHAVGRMTGCIDPETNQLRPESGCAKMRDNLNAGMSLQDAIYERWFTAKQEGEKMKYQMTIVVEDDSLGKAVVKGESIGEVLNAQVRPERPQQPPRPPGNISSGITVTPATKP